MTTIDFTLKRSFDLFFSCIGILIFGIPMLCIALLIKVTSPGNALFVQTRIGRVGKPCRIHKFRTMYTKASQENSITIAGDKRITGLGKVLRKCKLDELPQLFDVFVGTMSFVGPRPDVSGYADMLKGEDKKILLLRPGITGPATLEFRNEEEILSQVVDPKEYNDSVIWPKKVEINKNYLDSWSFWGDVWYILITLLPFLAICSKKSSYNAR